MPERRLTRLLKAKLLRRSSTPAVPDPGNGADPRVHPNLNSTSGISGTPHLFDSASEKSPYSVVSSAAQSSDDTASGQDVQESPRHTQRHRGQFCNPSPRQSDQHLHHHPSSENLVNTPPTTEPKSSPLPTPLSDEPTYPLDLSIPTPQHSDDTSLQVAQVKVRTPSLTEYQLTPTLETVVEAVLDDHRPSVSFFPPQSSKRPSLASRRQSLLPASQQHLISGLLEQSLFASPSDHGSSRVPVTAANMVTRRIWVKRPGGSATLVPCLEDAVVDELRDQVIMKYGNSLGRTFDSPDIVIRIVAREASTRLTTTDRLLSPEEVLASVLDSYYPDGQSIEEALLIEAPSRRTPKPSPRPTGGYHHHHPEPGEHGEYFPLMPANTKAPTPPTHSSSSGGTNPQSISILTNGVAPAIPSPGGRPRRHQPSLHRPPLQRHTTNSPTMLGQVPTVTETGVSPHSQPPPTIPPQNVPTPPATVAESPQAKSHTPPAPIASPRSLRKSKAAVSPGAAFGGLIDGTVPPINVLIVEDNIINQKLLEAFMKRLSVRWKCAANGEEAVRKWRQGGFHLVLMDIQLPVMNGLDATKEIRRLERLNGIGVFSKTASGRSSASSANEKRPGLYRSVSEEDTLSDLSLFRSPVIIVALTASSLQSDRHEALAAGCNDFLTKPVGFPWLEQKVTEWGCMQALIDFEGWRKWRGFMDSPRSLSPSIQTAASPMQTGSRESVAQPEVSSPSVSRTKSKPKGLKPPNLPDADEIMRQNSWGSGTGGSATSYDASPAEAEFKSSEPSPGSANES
ncbi:hypothetical protein N7478_005519 [Penicillium angulare]|uniref:uncharacterized protein n=1 Tax=Penicillium angulare TaxID=116970 RepID=UPI002541AAC6|nr:uncharacterized protein N7478_005519 [Penicillium angulare]KAJ5280147.1 hypothetical protein N7478_005519 [Penicillium angulare]